MEGGIEGEKEEEGRGGRWRGERWREEVSRRGM